MQENLSISTLGELSKRDQLVNLIINRLTEAESSLQRQFLESVGDVGVRYCYVDDLLPDETARSIYDAFPSVDSMRLMKSFREQKYTSKSFEKFDPLMRDITFAIQDPRVVAVIERITGIKHQIPDEHLYAGGLSAMGRDHFLGPHIDNSHDADRIHYRTLNLLYYISPDWKCENGGNLELWDKSVLRHVTIDSKFNRLAIMETNPWSWHSVSKIGVERHRCCISNYYFSPVSPIGRDYFNVTSFSARPEQKVRRALAWVDNRLRQSIRVVIPQGVGKKDLYEGPAK
jgi:Rps23 Pro-64 3,4-dihydroxylase Tpa1-like proline 4-hydroxylase